MTGSGQRRWHFFYFDYSTDRDKKTFRLRKQRIAGFYALGAQKQNCSAKYDKI